MSRSDDLAPLLAEQSTGDLQYRQGVVAAWDPETGANSVRMGDTVLTDLQMAISTERWSIQPGHKVALIGWRSSWFILGRITGPHDPTGREIRLVVYSEDGIIVRGGGGVTVEDGGTIRARHPDGSIATALGTIAGGERVGLIVRADNSQDNSIILQARQEPGGTRTLLAAADTVDIATATAINLNAPTHTTSHGVFVSVPTVTGTANVLRGASGRLAQIGSSRRYKQDIEDLDVDPDKVLRLRPRTWHDRAFVEEYPDDPPRIPGFIAEEVHDIGLTEFVLYDEQGRPDALAYDRMTAGLLAVVQRQAAQIEDLTNRVAALEGAT